MVVLSPLGLPGGQVVLELVIFGLVNNEKQDWNRCGRSFLGRGFDR